MKVVHFCPIYIDGWGYQDNLLPRYFKEAGHEVSVISLNKIPKHISGRKKFNKRYNNEGVEIIRIKTYLFLTFTLFLTKGLYRALKNQKPDILFHHDVCLTSLLVCVFYKILHSDCKLFVDNHADMINKPRSNVWFLVYYKFVLRTIGKLSSPFVEKFYGVTLGRCDFLEQVFGVDKTKIKLLPIGADTISVESIKDNKLELRKEFNISFTDFIIISGGKMSVEKGTDLLIEAVNNLNKADPNIKLILFGQYEEKIILDAIENSKCVIYFDWCDRIQTLKLLKLADVSVWPIHHTTLIEDSIACLTPIIVRKTRTTEHLVNGNGIFIETVSSHVIKDAILRIMKSDSSVISSNCKVMRDRIDYSSIVNQIINDSMLSL